MRKLKVTVNDFFWHKFKPVCCFVAILGSRWSRVHAKMIILYVMWEVEFRSKKYKFSQYNFFYDGVFQNLFQKIYRQVVVEFWCLTPLSTIFLLYRGWQTLLHNVASSIPASVIHCQKIYTGPIQNSKIRRKSPMPEVGVPWF
jgi:hypothetical protein